MSRTVAFATLGCRLNQVDTQEMQARLEARGFRTVAFDQPADLVVVNSCTVTGRAEFSDRQMIRRAARLNPSARIVVTGCWAQTDPAAVAATGADAVVGNADKARIADVVESLLADSGAAARPSGRGVARVHVSDVSRVTDVPSAPAGSRLGRSRAFVKIQEGCQHRCAFCIVPRARGRSRSQRPEVVIDQVRQLVAAGHPEVVLTGVDMGHWGADLTPRTTLAVLLRALVGVPGLRWLRLSSLLPAYFTPQLLEVIESSPVIAPHLHVPLQSGSDRVLRLMRRPYTVRMYRALVERLAARIPSLGLGTDVIAGFPGETDEDFAATRGLVEDLPFSYLHVFAYSERKGTEAATMTGRLPARTVTIRAAALREISQKKSLAFREALVDTVRDVLVLETRDRLTGRLVGLTANYVEVVFEGADTLMRGMTQLRVTGADLLTTEGALA
ncbi:MAG: tRNA (N(6)-L-threonylcarbamoyladenosine(37)-C(2))-methylthiotransferase MtaB [Candidatus Rokubacteria bacterium]|nr:tRNA (N(6)-L-threonylcarbamoyladenosine(37)-C(2))-methylthiotransferase MtaB [Candidatus Rokubacteria bacterium]